MALRPVFLKVLVGSAIVVILGCVIFQTFSETSQTQAAMDDLKVLNVFVGAFYEGTNRSYSIDSILAQAQESHLISKTDSQSLIDRNASRNKEGKIYFDVGVGYFTTPALGAKVLNATSADGEPLNLVPHVLMGSNRSSEPR